MSEVTGGITTTRPDGSSVHYSHAEYEERLGRVARLWYEEAVWAQRIDPDFQFEVGCQYLTLGGRVVTIVEKTGPVDSSGFPNMGYECVKGDDDVWRYNRSTKSHECRAAPEGLGRTTGSSWDRLDNLVPVKLQTQGEYVWRWRWSGGGVWRYTDSDERPNTTHLEKIAPFDLERVMVMS